MKTPNIRFSIGEKLAIVQALDALILADGTVHNGEINALTELMKTIDFDSNFMVQARSIPQEQCAQILRAMPKAKKDELATILKDMAISDGFEHQKEANLIESILSSIGFIALQK